MKPNSRLIPIGLLTLGEIDNNSDQDAISTLIDDILFNGLQKPLKVIAVDQTHFEIVSGKKRFMAISILKRDHESNSGGNCPLKGIGMAWEVPCIILSEYQQEADEDTVNEFIGVVKPSSHHVSVSEADVPSGVIGKATPSTGVSRSRSGKSDLQNQIRSFFDCLDIEGIGLIIMLAFYIHDNYRSSKVKEIDWYNYDGVKISTKYNKPSMECCMATAHHYYINNGEEPTIDLARELLSTRIMKYNKAMNYLWDKI